MGILQIFATPEELDSILETFALEKGLVGCSYEAGAYKLTEKGLLPIFRNGTTASHFSLLTPEQWSPNPRPRDLGWLQVTPGSVFRLPDEGNILTMSSINGGEKRTFGALRRRVARSFTFGRKL